jgi:O-antigen/teichoic acid export membrane protein
MRDELPASYADRTVMRELLAGSAITFAGSMVANVLGVAYTIGMARLLAPPAYADLVTLLSLLGVASLPGSTIQTIVARATALAIGRNEPHAGNQVLTRIGRGVVLAAVIALLCTLVAVPWLGRFLQLGEVASLWPFAALIGLGFLHPLLRGLAQGQARYALLTAVGLLDSVGKVAGGTFLGVVSHKVVDREARRERGVRPLMPRCGRSWL